LTTFIDALPREVMVVDDEPDMSLVVKMSLEHAGYRANAFTSPAQALKHFKLNADRYGLVISDIRMPEMNGMELVAGIREFDASIPVILMSAFVTASDVDPGLNVAGLLEKPISREKLVKTVSKYIQITAK